MRTFEDTCKEVFDGDGRQMTSCGGHLLHVASNLGVRSLAMRRGTARLLGEEFERVGRSMHSAGGYTVWVSLAKAAVLSRKVKVTALVDDRLSPVGWVCELQADGPFEVQPRARDWRSLEV